MNKLLRLLLLSTAVVGCASVIKVADTLKTDALSYQTLSTIKDKEIIEFEGGDTLPEGTSISYNVARSYLNDSYKNARIYAARMYTGNYSCSPINEVEQEVYLNGETKTKLVNTTGGYVLGFDNGASVTVSYTSAKERYADLYIRVSSNNATRDGDLPYTNTMKLQKMMGISLNDEDVSINDNATVFGRRYKERLEDDVNNTISFGYEKNSDGTWKILNTNLNMYGRYVYQDWQTVLVGKVLVKEGINTFVYTAKNSNTSGQLDCMILDFDKYNEKDVYEFEDAALAGGAKSIANYEGDYQDLICDFVTYNKDYSCSNYDFVKYAKKGASLTMNIDYNSSYVNPHLLMRVSSLQVDQGTYTVKSIDVKNHLGVTINGNTLNYPSDTKIEGRNDSLKHDPDGISHGIAGSLNSLGSTSDNGSYSPRYLYLIWRTIDLGPISLQAGTNEIKFEIINDDSNNEYIGFDYFAISETNDTTYDAKKYSNKYISRIVNVCDPNGNTNVEYLKKIWTEMRSEYATLNSDVQVLIVNSQANSLSENVIERFVERYDYIGNKYQGNLVDDGEWNFLNRTISHNSINILFNKSGVNATIFAVLILIPSIAIVSGLILIKKQKSKEN